MRELERSLPCRLTDEEQRDRGKALAIARQNRNAAEAVRVVESKKLKAVVDDADLEVDRLAQIVRSGQEYRPVVCREVLAGAQVEIVRTDTGEIVETRAATDADRQRPLFLAPEPTGRARRSDARDKPAPGPAPEPFLPQ